MDWTLTGVAAVIAFVASWAGTLALIRALGRGAILDHPNERSSHSIPVPRGGGIAVIGTLGVLWSLLAATGYGTAAGLHWLILATAALAVIGWLDDLHGLHPAPRLLVHVAAVAVGLVALDGSGPVFQGLLPPWLDRLAAALAWLWFLNLYNFMDGIDGMAAGETTALGLGVIAVAATACIAPDLLPHAATMVGAVLGFWWWNAHPARIFLGDVGSVPLGFLAGWMLLSLAAAGAWAAALILPLYYLADATLTLGARIARRERFWEAHRQHFYQRAAARGIPHDAVVRAVLVANAVFVALAAAAAFGARGPALFAAAATCAMLLVYLDRVGR